MLLKVCQVSRTEILYMTHIQTTFFHWSSLPYTDISARSQALYALYVSHLSQMAFLCILHYTRSRPVPFFFFILIDVYNA